jgi:hypothetical protein
MGTLLQNPLRADTASERGRQHMRNPSKFLPPRRRMKLTPEMVPQPLWGINACKRVRPQSLWRSIRSRQIDRAGGCCEVCEETTPPPYCHEQWHYDDRKSRATLTGFQVLCQNCNGAVHIALAYNRRKGAEALAQLARVNSISELEVNQIAERATATWEKRSQKNWRLSVKPRLLRAFPQLRVLVGIDIRSNSSYSSSIEID